MNLKEFFIDKNIKYPFKLFGKAHLYLLFFLILIIYIIIKHKKELNNIKPKTKKIITNIFAVILLMNMIILYCSSFYYHNFDYHTMLPIHLCYLSNYFYIYVIIFKKTKLLKFCYLLGFLGPIPAIIFFDVPSVFESFNFYIISHHIFLIMTIITFYFYPKNITIKDNIKLFMILNILYFLINIFNQYFNTNYFFTNGIPNFILNLIPLIKLFPYAIILEFMIILLMFILSYIWHHEWEHLLKH